MTLQEIRSYLIPLGKIPLIFELNVHTALGCREAEIFVSAQGAMNSLNSLRRNEMMSFDNLEGTKGYDAEKNEIQASEKDKYLETVLMDYKSEKIGAPEKAAESRNVEVQPTAGFTTKQVMSFLTAKHRMKGFLLLFIK